MQLMVYGKSMVYPLHSLGWLSCLTHCVNIDTLKFVRQAVRQAVRGSKTGFFGWYQLYLSMLAVAFLS